MGPARRIRRSCAVATVLVAASMAPAALGAGVSPLDATAAQKKDATDKFVAGKTALGSKNWDAAVSELRASLDIVDSPNARLELARALREQGKPADAWTEYTHTIDGALALAPKEPRYTKTAEAATTERAEVEGRIGLVTVTVERAPAGATLTIGGQQVPESRWGKPVAAAPGPLEISLRAGGNEVAHKSISVAAGDKPAVALDGAPAPQSSGDGAASAASGAPSSGGESPDAPSDHSALRPYAYVAGGVGVVGLALFTVFGLLSNSTYGDLQSACPHGQCPSGKQGEIDSGRMQQTVANVGLGVGIAGLVAGAALYLYSRPPRPQGPGAALVIGPGYLGVRGSL